MDKLFYKIKGVEGRRGKRRDVEKMGIGKSFGGILRSVFRRGEVIRVVYRCLIGSGEVFF